MVKATAVLITVCNARELYYTNLITKMDPFCRVTLGTKSQETEPHKGGNTAPEWNKSFTFPFDDDPTLHFEVYDKDVFTKDDYIGACDLQLKPIIEGAGKFRGDLPLMRKEGKPGGYLKIDVSFLMDTKHEAKPEPVAQAQPQAYPPQPAYAHAQPYAPMPQPGYPPQPYGYPPQPQGYPPQGYPPQPGYPPQTGYGPQGYPPRY
eukprot:Platyproteum_vivax@DN1745_c0_g1_i2.p1